MCVCVCVSPHHDIAAAGGVRGVAQRADFGVSLVFKVHLLVLNAHLSAPWWTRGQQEGGNGKGGRKEEEE